MASIPKRPHTSPEAEETDGREEQCTHIEESADILVLLNAENSATYVSSSVGPILGYTPEEIVGHDLTMLIHADDLAALQQVLSEVGQIAGKSLSSEYRLCCKDGTWRWFEGNITNLLTVSGVIMANFRTSTKQDLMPYLEQRTKELEAAMIEHQRTEDILFHLAAIVESSDDAILSKDLNGIVTSWNAAAERIYGYT